MARGEDTRDHPSRRIGKPAPTPFFELNDSAQQVARDWSQGNNTALGRFATTGKADKAALAEVRQTLDFGAPHAHEKLRLTNLHKHLQAQQESED